MNKLKIQHIKGIVLIALLIIISYWGVWKGYFEQDEWHTFARFIEVREGGKEELLKQLLVSGPLTHFTPLAFLTKYSLFNLFNLNAAGYFWSSIVLHTAASVFLYFLIYRLTSNKNASFLGSLFFATNSTHRQAVSWIGTFEGTQGAVIFGIAFLIIFNRFLKEQRTKLLAFSLFCLFIALLFKETAISFVIIGLYLTWKDRIKNKRKIYTCFLLTSLIYILLRFLYIPFGLESYPSAIGGNKIPYTKVLSYNLISIPPKALSLGFFPKDLLIDLSSFIDTKYFNNKVFPYDIWRSQQFIFFDIISISAGLLLFVYLFKKFSKNEIVKIGLVMVMSGIVPLFVFRSPLVFIDSRFFYVISVGTAIIISGIYKSLKSKKTFISILMVLILLHVFVNIREIHKSIEIGRLRSRIIAKFQETVPQLPERVVFYTESSKSYYGLPDEKKILPFQSGVGQMLLVIYNHHGQISSKFFENDFLWEIDAQGYREIGDRGFGYFRDPDLLKSAISDYNIPHESIYAFSWNGRTKEFSVINNEKIKK